MTTASLSAATKVHFFLLHICLMVSVPEEHHKMAWYIVKKALNIIVAMALSLFLCFMALFHIWYSITGLKSPYETGHALSVVMLTLGFRWGCQNSFRSFFAEFESYRQRHRPGEAVQYRRVLIMGVLSLATMIVICSYSTIEIIVYTDQDLCYTIHEALPESFADFKCHPLVAWLSSYFTWTVITAQFWLYLSVWTVLKTEANAVVQAVTELEKETAKDAPEVLERIRLRHADLCCLISKANRFLTPMFVFVFASGIGCILLIVHKIVSDQYFLHRQSVGDLLNQFVSVLAFLVVFTLTGASLNVKMHEPVNFLFQLDVLQMSGRGTEVVSMFLSRVQGAPIAFSVLNLFAVDPPAILTLGGALLTYIIVIVQFVTPAVSCSTGSQHNASLPGHAVTSSASFPQLNATTSTA